MEIRNTDAVKDAAKTAVKKSLEIEPGDHHVSFVLRGTADLRKGEDFEQVIAQSACPYTLLAAALDKLNLATAGVIVDLVKEVQAMDEKARREMREAVKGKTAEAMKALGLSSTKVVSGKVTFQDVSARLHFVESGPQQDSVDVDDSTQLIDALLRGDPVVSMATG